MKLTLRMKNMAHTHAIVVGVLVSCKFCGAHKVTEFNRRTNLLTIWHQGQHICKLQPNVHHQDEIIQEESCRRPPVNIQLRNTTCEFQIDLIGYYILIGNQEKAIELAEGLADKNLVDKLRNKNRNDVLGDLKYGYGDLMQQFKNVGKLKATSDKQDEFHIYKMNCSTLNGKPSYVFKTSHEAAELALKMDSEIPQGKDSAMNEEDAYFDGMHS